MKKDRLFPNLRFGRITLMLVFALLMAATSWAATPVKYLDEKGLVQTVTDYILLTGTESADDAAFQKGGWYVVQGNVEYDGNFAFGTNNKVDVNLILADGAKLTVRNSKPGFQNLAIYAQSKGENMGQFDINSESYAIFLNENFVLNGGVLNATGGSHGIFTYRGDVMINGGVLKVNGRQFGIGILFDGKVTINGGSITATGEIGGIRSVKDVTINGGVLEATANDRSDGILSLDGDIILGWTDADNDRITASSVRRAGIGKVVKIANGKAFVDEFGNVYSGTLTSEQLTAIKGKTLRPFLFTLTFATDDENVVVNPQKVEIEAIPAKPSDPVRNGFIFLGWFADEKFQTEFDWTKPLVSDTTVFAKWGFQYLDKKGVEQIVTDFTLLTGNESADDEVFKKGGWYIVQGNVEYDGNFAFGSRKVVNVNLILADGAKLTVRNSKPMFNDLVIYAQSTGKNKGQFEINVGDNKIDVKANFVLNGGAVTATGTSTCISAVNVTINGGVLEVAGDDRGIHAPNNIIIGWTDMENDRVTVSGFFYSDTGVVKIADGQYFTDGEGHLYQGTLNKQLAAIAGKTLRPIVDFTLTFATGDESIVVNPLKVPIGAIPAKPSDPVRADYKFLGWFADEGLKTEFDWKKPLSANTTVFAKWELVLAKYLDKNGVQQTVTDFTLLTGDESADDEIFKKGGWYVVLGNVEYDGNFAFNYSRLVDVNLILADGAKLTVRNSKPMFNDLVIYAQSTGKNKGQFDINVGDDKIDVNGNFVLNGGAVTATGTSTCISAVNVAINGGVLEVAGGDRGIHAPNNIILGGTDVENERVTVSGFYSDTGDVKIADGLYFTDGEGHLYQGSLNGQLAAIAGKTLRPIVDYTLAFATGAKNVVINPQKVAIGTPPTKPSDPVRLGCKFLGWFADEEFQTEFDWTKPLVSDTTVFVKWEMLPVKYLDENGVEQTVTDYTLLTGKESADDEIFTKGGWYVVLGNVEYDGNFGFNSGNYYRNLVDVNLILADGAKLTVRNSYPEFKNLTIYAQSTGKDMGQFDINAEFIAIELRENFVLNGGAMSVIAGTAGIVTEENFTVNGGIIVAVSTEDGFAMPIYVDGTVSVNGGNVSATGSSAIGINANRGLIVKGGSVKALAKGNSGFGIYLRYGTARLMAGTVTAEGSVGGIVVTDPAVVSTEIILEGATVTATNYMYRNPNDDSFGAVDGVVKIADGLHYTDDEGHIYQGTLGEETLAAIAGKTLSPDIPIIRWTTDENRVVATIDGNSTKKAKFGFEDDVLQSNPTLKADVVTFNREFTPGAFSTLSLPFDFYAKDIKGLSMLLKFNGLKQKEINGKKQWVVRMKKLWAPNSDKDDVQLKAYKPYMVLTDSKTITFDGSVNFVDNLTAEKEITDNGGNANDLYIDEIGDWTFKSAFSYKKWSAGDDELGLAYGFSAQSEDNIGVGEFVKVGENAYINPFRSYLLKKAGAKGVRSSIAGNKASISTMGLPEVIDVEIEEDDGENGGDEPKTTVIGKFNTRTGEFTSTASGAAARTFDVKGRNAGTKANKARGAYYGKKTVR